MGMTSLWVWLNIVSRPINIQLKTAKSIVKATACLHNWLMKMDVARYCPPGTTDTENEGSLQPGSWRADYPAGECVLRPLHNNTRNMRTPNALEVRYSFKEYFANEGAVPWQLQMI
ncbi:hypothetical protein PR048_013536 [Dryococelus australis]|uniref:Nuclease HARBI1 n=1 Tax=Dryococelus australis TaxID=614101 RepID=A0ABQ9HSL5_9NEOP|nr:hypothetical protein PR048_013536 [Dryococelus australis]